MWGFNKGKITTLNLTIIVIVVILGYSFITVGVNYVAYDKQIEAAKLMEKCMDAILEQKIDFGFSVDTVNDPNRTGLIGDVRSSITTTKGFLHIKRTTTSPSFAALMIRYFTELELKAGDVIAVGSSGSFPGLSLAVICAAEIMNLKPIFIYSIGASNYGANNPEFTFIDILKNLNDLKLLNTQIEAISLGGARDVFFGEFYENSKKVALEVAEKSDVETFIYEEDLANSIKKRMQIYFKTADGCPIKCFIDVGGADSNVGETSFVLNLPKGLIKDPIEPPISDTRGVMMEFAALGVPLIYLSEIIEIAQNNNIMIDPVPFPPLGKDGVYKVLVNNKLLIVLIFLLLFAILIFNSRLSQRNKGRVTCDLRKVF